MANLQVRSARHLRGVLCLWPHAGGVFVAVLIFVQVMMVMDQLLMDHYDH